MLPRPARRRRAAACRPPGSNSAWRRTPAPRPRRLAATSDPWCVRPILRHTTTRRRTGDATTEAWRRGVLGEVGRLGADRAVGREDDLVDLHLGLGEFLLAVLFQKRAAFIRRDRLGVA